MEGSVFLLMLAHGLPIPPGSVVTIPPKRAGQACGALRLTSSCTLRGPSPTERGFCLSILCVTEGAKVIIEDVDVDVPPCADPTACGNALHVQKGSVVEASRCSFRSAQGPGVAVGGGSLLMRDCKVEGCAEGGVVASGDQAMLHLESCVIRNNKAAGAEVRDGASLRMNACVLERNGRQGVASWAKGKIVTMTDCVVNDHQRESAILHSAGIGVFRRCTVQGSSFAGFAVGQGGSKEVRAVIDNCSASGCRHGVLVQQGRCKVTICESKFTHNSLYGLFVGADTVGEVSADKCELTDNRLAPHYNQAKGMCTTTINGRHICTDPREGLLSKETVERRLRSGPPSVVEDAARARQRAGLDIGIPVCRGCRKEESAKGKRFQACGVCRGVRYCGRACQKKDWRRHREECKRVAKYPAFGDEGVACTEWPPTSE